MKKQRRYSKRKLREDNPLSYDRKGAQRFNFAIVDILNQERPAVFRVNTEDQADVILANLNFANSTERA